MDENHCNIIYNQDPKSTKDEKRNIYGWIVALEDKRTYGERW